MLAQPEAVDRAFEVGCEHLGRGLRVDETIAKTKQTCEGEKSCQSILDLATRNEVDMPIVEQVVQVVHNGMPPREMAYNLMSRDPKAEQGHQGLS